MTTQHISKELNWVTYLFLAMAAGWLPNSYPWVITIVQFSARGSLKVCVVASAVVGEWYQLSALQSVKKFALSVRFLGID